MSASDSPGLLAGNPPFAAGCPGWRPGLPASWRRASAKKRSSN